MPVMRMLCAGSLAPPLRSPPPPERRGWAGQGPSCCSWHADAALLALSSAALAAEAGAVARPAAASMRSERTVLRALAVHFVCGVCYTVVAVASISGAQGMGRWRSIMLLLARRRCAACAAVGCSRGGGRRRGVASRCIHANEEGGASCPCRACFALGHLHRRCVRPPPCGAVGERGAARAPTSSLRSHAAPARPHTAQNKVGCWVNATAP